MSKEINIVSVTIFCKGEEVMVPWDVVDFTASVDECECCGDHGEVKLEIWDCPNCGKRHEVSVRDW